MLTHIWICEFVLEDKLRKISCLHLQIHELEQRELMSLVVILFSLILIDQSQCLCKQGQRNYVWVWCKNKRIVVKEFAGFHKIVLSLHFEYIYLSFGSHCLALDFINGLIF